MKASQGGIETRILEPTNISAEGFGTKYENFPLYC